MNLYGLTPTHVMVAVVAGTLYYNRKHSTNTVVKRVAVNVLVTVVALAFVGVPVLETFNHPDAVWNAAFTGDGEYTPTYPSDEKAKEFRNTVEFDSV